MSGLDISEWGAGFDVTGKGLVCQVCRCVVRQTPGDAEAHRKWHDRIEGPRGQ